MTEQEKRKIYRSKVQLLIDYIRGIINSSLPKAEQSKRIMARLREEHIFAKNSYINKFENASFVTIDPYAEDVKPELEDGDIEGTSDDEYCKIHANSFGPFNPDEYFKEGSFRILWILKEPYVKNGEYEDLKCSRRKFLGGHDQADEYYKAGWESINGEERNPTIANLIKISKVILEELGEPFNGNDEEAVMKQVMGHICILEVNHFPGLALDGIKSNDKNIGKWAEINADLISILIDFYNPDVIIGGNTLGHFLTSSDYNVIFKNIANHRLNIFGNPIVEWAYIDSQTNKEVTKPSWEEEHDNEEEHRNVGRGIKYLREDGKIFIDTYHPIRYNKVRAEKTGIRIKQWFETKR